jgi:hypothetical protein
MICGASVGMDLIDSSVVMAIRHTTNLH